MSSQRYSEMKELDKALGECMDDREKLRELNAELLEALKYARLFIGQPTPVSLKIDELIAKAENLNSPK